MELDAALEVLSRMWGRFQMVNYSLLCVPIMFHASFYLSYVFAAKQVEHRCFIPECELEPLLSETRPPWLPESAVHSCLRPAALPAGVAALNASWSCASASFSDQMAACDQWVYPNKHLSIMSEWDMTCGDNWKVTLVGTINNVGRFFGMPVAGLVSDRYGRRTVLLAGLALAGAMGLLRSLATNYVFFVVFEFLDPLCYAGLFSAAFILGMELLPAKRRVLWSAFTHSVYAAGSALLGAVAWALLDWRWTLRAFYGPALLSLSVLWVLPESIRWLASKGRNAEALGIIRRAAHLNHIPADQLNVDDIKLAACGKPSDTEERDDSKTVSQELRATVKSPVLLWRLLNCCFCWLTNMFVYDGLSLNSVAVAGNQYLNFILVCLIEVPAGLATWALMERVGRRAAMCSSLLLAGAACIAFHFLPAGVAWMRVAVYLLGKFGITISYTVIYVLTAELFPTKVRHSLFAVCSTVGRVGSILAPQTPLLAAYLDSLPLILFGSMSIASGVLSFWFPETNNIKLPDTVEEAEQIGRRQKKMAKAPAASGGAGGAGGYDNAVLDVPGSVSVSLPAEQPDRQ
ncbi:hypothetical protein ONE63_000383 [Megalurothrips usitatus]|uniref:Major facilitator superfamily (MFS) profile domain-containing protein n=1 Tax=Megalurothrips usitatus TaxID=439358 RepID=A0AAV7XZB7_9NEOP|nr:hypothetical protein ONE63_000383 [Megalurothrips usitatus]